MALIRPEAAATLRRWRELLAGGAALALGLWWAVFSGPGVLRWMGIATLLIGAALVVAGVQRARFRAGNGEGPGVVQVVEGRIAYFGPLEGGVADLESLEVLSLDTGARPAHWRLQQPGQQDLAIPVNAQGAEALFDAFASLPGIRTEYMLRRMRSRDAGVSVIWRAPHVQDRRARLH
ncbi:hypothetical protein [Pseudoponticoccus marisrubri]|uniref:Uncharacterized protein n=1 Tax=Pseudoponticoccus marisrubri TaxID=1685382 RepID=A0A0W7WQG6_9RHOB|nr:hypothetical protein [Pseudoponticoccus marisrubri]KUF12728.1 hypothetical protein AVJ23_03155 [Pseudoponticoccus marisrubri]